MSAPGGGIVFSIATSAFFRATQFFVRGRRAGRVRASAPSSPATSAFEGAETESYAGQIYLKAIIAGFCAPLPAPLPIVALVAGLTSTQETRLTLDAC